jgi:hypothetical protein
MNHEDLATKKDLADGFAAAKKDLTEGLVAFENKLLNELVTKKELAETNKKLDDNTKELVKINDRMDRLTVVVLQHSEVLQSMQETVQKVAHNQDRFMEILTDYTGDIKDYRLERVATDAAFARHAAQLQNHELRINALEDKIVS